MADSGLGLARLWAAAKFPYLASGLFGLVPVPVPGIGTVAVDEQWRLWADPEVTARWSVAEYGSVLVHHVCHLLREHGTRATGAGVLPADSRAWIRAADAEINDDLVPAALQLPGSPVLPRHLGCPDGQLAEAYFSAGVCLHSAVSRPVPGHLAERPAWELDCGSGADGVGRPWEGTGGQGLGPWQSRLLCRLVAQEVARSGQEPGTVPAGLLRWADSVLEPAVNWRRVLSAEVRKAIADTMGAVDYTYRRPSRRAAAVGQVILPALRRPLPNVAVVCDTSGSMTDDLLAKALAEVNGLLRAIGMARQLRVIACDAAASTARRVTSASQVELTGGGGTDMGAGIAAAAALRPRPSVTVVLTDGCTPWPDEAPRGMRVVVGLLGPDAPQAPGWAREIRVGG